MRPRNAVQEWDRNIDALELEETSSKMERYTIEFQEKHEGHDKQKELVAHESINTFDTSSFVHKVLIIVHKAVSDFKFHERTVERIVKHEMGHALGLGHANFDGNLMG
jgi:predicted Zn-dependent protease